MYIQCMEYEWDENKNKTNKTKHRISFEEAVEIFDYSVLELECNRFDYGETRYIGIGRNRKLIILTVVFTERKPRLRIISARRANKKERSLYHEYCSQKTA